VSSVIEDLKRLEDRILARIHERRERVLKVVAVEPGISVREIGTQLGVNRTSLYPVVRELVSDGLLHKDGRGLWLASP
jgi:DNA-binding IclR family transcriptional regulator